MDTLELEECRVLRVEPGDIVVFETEQPLTAEMVERIKDELAEILKRAGHEGIPTAVTFGGRLTTTRVAAAE